MDRRVTTAIVAGLGQFLVDHAEEVAAYVEEVHKAIGGVPSAAGTVTPAVADKTPELEAGQRVHVTAHFTHSTVPDRVTAEVVGVRQARDGELPFYAIRPKDLPPFAITWEPLTRRWAPVAPCPSWLDGCYKLDVTVETPPPTDKM